MTPAIVVTGSLNMDFVVTVPHLPAPGETVLGSDFTLIPGGKGANQACAAGKLGGSTRMVGCVGSDVFADQLKASLVAAGVDVSAVQTVSTQPSGVALIWVDEHGQNSIVVAPGANHAFTPADVEALRSGFGGARFGLFQLETPLETVAAAMRVAREAGAQTILDPAPAQPLSRDLLRLVDILTPNESEACLLLGRPAARVTPADAPALAQSLRALGAASVLLKLGEQGCYYSGPGEERYEPAFPVEVRDTTAAGDTFNGALAVALAEGAAIPQALRFANAAAALSVTQLGAQASIPSRAPVTALLRS
jgi:ribokinase